MATWGELVEEIRVEGFEKQNNQILEIIRKRSISELYKLTGRNTIVYFSSWTSHSNVSPNLVSISEEDVQGFMHTIVGLKGDNLDLLLHTGGGSAETTDAIVSYLRKKFNHIRIIIPQAAMSAGTMLACCANEIVMGKHSSIGPIDPQFILATSVGVQALPAHAIIQQFRMAQTECAQNPSLLNSWLPMLSQYGPALLVKCQNQIDFSKMLVENWLFNYMFNKDDKEKASYIAEYLCNHAELKTHGKHIDINEAKNIGLNVKSLEDDQKLQETVLTAFHACTLTFTYSPATKIIQNHNGNAFIKQMSTNKNS